MVHASVAPLNQKHSEHRGGLLSANFLGLLLTQFLSIINDNLLKWLVAEIAIHEMGDEYRGFALGGGTAAFVLPFIIFASPAGYLADRFSKRNVIVYVKAIELVVAVLATLAIGVSSTILMFLTLFLLGTQASLFGPSKLGSIPEYLKSEKLSIANGVANLATVVAIIIGTIAGFKLYDLTGPSGHKPVQIPGIGTVNGLAVSGTCMLGLAIVGLLASMVMRPVPAANPKRVFHWNLISSTRRDLKLISRDWFLLRVALGGAFFWSLACLAQLNLEPYADKILNLSKEQTGHMMGFMAAGVCVGSVLAGVWSGAKVQMRLVPWAAGGLVVCGVMLYVSQNVALFNMMGLTVLAGWMAENAVAITTVWLFLLGAFGGAYDVPLMAYLQKYSREEERGSVFAANNFFTFAGMFVISLLFFVLSDLLKVTPPWVFMLSGLITIPVGVAMYRLSCENPSA